MDKSIHSKEYQVFLRHLRQARKKAGLTQIQLARRLSETQSFVSKCERGERRLDIVEVRRICTGLRSKEDRLAMFCKERYFGKNGVFWQA
ncbi:MAG: helix-turn-helix transcriptional regulator [Planctomycetes bacterium]|nr:helix-turn-helix transcriptional regulator [Planctomycetota bacterium]MBI3835491.1 helix-turn-helix transcriptional regulator [Planctomycetota bacterium]